MYASDAVQSPWRVIAESAKLFGKASLGLQRAEVVCGLFDWMGDCDSVQSFESMFRQSLLAEWIIQSSILLR